MPRSLDTMVLLVGAIALAAVSLDQSGAQSASSRATRSADGTIAVEAVYLAPETCWSVQATAAGRPAGADAGADAGAGTIGATVTVRRDGDLCGQALTTLRAAFRLPPAASASAVELSIVATDGRVVKTERLPLRR